MDLEQLEGLAWGEDRAAALAQLIPGTEEYYFYHCLHHHHLGQLEEVERMLVTWQQRHGETERYQQIRRRHALLSYDRSPQASLEYLVDELGLDHSHQREVEGEQAAYPSKLDASLIARDTLRDRAFASHSGLGGVTDRALVWLAGQTLDPTRRRGLLERVRHPDYPNLVDHLLADLEHTRASSFSGLAVVPLLTAAQLDELVRRRPSLLDDETIVDIRIKLLAPGPDTAWLGDDAERSAYLDRLWAFVEPLSPSFNSLRAHVLYHRLDLDRSRGRYDTALFEQYLKLPRQASYVAEALLRATKQASRAQLGYHGPTGLPPVGSDEELVGDYFAHIFADAAADDYERYKPYVRESYLRRLFATTKILCGAGDPERWYTLLDDPTAYQALKERVDIDFTCRNREYFGATDAVTLEVDTKNVQTLVVKVFEINTLSYFLAHRRDVDTSIDLDGLVASEETTYTYDDPALRRVRRTFELPNLAKPGVYVVELIGGGKSSRALIRKGHLRYVERVGAAGHAITVIGEDGEVATDAAVWLGAREHRAGDDGEIVIPFSTNPRREHILLRRGDITTLETLDHQSESYAFSANIHIDREQLIGGETATVLIRPQLTLNGVTVSVDLLEKVVLAIKCVDLHGVSARVEVPGFALSDEAEAVHTFTVPEETVSVDVELRARVRNVSRAEDLDVSASHTFALNGIDATAHVECAHLSRTAGGYVVRVLGKTGEERAGRLVSFELFHTLFQEPLRIPLQTDARGRIELGALDDILSVRATTQAGVDERWPLIPDACVHPHSVHARTGAPIAIPYAGKATALTIAELSLLERRGAGFLRDCRDAASLEDGFVVLRGLSAGDYLLVLRETGRRIEVRVTDGPSRAGWAIAPGRLLELSPAGALHIAAAESRAGAVELRVANATPRTRVHVFAGRFEGDVGPWSLAVGAREVARVDMTPIASDYLSGRDIGDEYRYILERKHAAKFPGNMLRRPGLLLNPWERRSTDAELDRADEGGSYAKKRSRGGRASAPSPKMRPQDAGGGRGFANIDFLAGPSLVAVNLRPDDAGLVRIDAERLAPHCRVVAVAIDGSQTVVRSIALADVAIDPRDRRLSNGLPAGGHFTEKNEISPLLAGQSVTIADPTTAKVETVDTLAGVYALFGTLSGDATLAEMSFIIEWPDLDDDTRRAKYSEYACHELSLFLYFKDRAFFDDVIAPYLRNKRDKTFIDHYLLGDDLTPYLASWAYSRLNIVERILLGRRVDGQHGPTARHIRDRFDLLAPDPEGDEHLFRTVLQGSALAPSSPPLAELAATAGFAGPAPQARIMGMPSVPMGGRAAAAPPPPPAPASATQAFMVDGLMAGAADDEVMAAAEVAYEESAKSEEAFAEREYDRAKRDARMRKETAAFYRKLDATKEWAENNYYHLRPEQQGPDLIRLNELWVDFAEHTGTGPFLSRHFARATSCFAEMMCALAVLDLPFTAGQHDIARVDGGGVRITAAGPAVVFHKQIKPAEPASRRVPILVSQNYFRADDRYRYEGSERIDKYVTDEFLRFTVYLCQVVLTNPTSSRQKLQLLLQIPEGAIPVSTGFETRGMHVTLESYATQSIEYSFYFPAADTFSHYPVHVSKNEELIASAEPAPINVVHTPSKIDTESWPHVSQHAGAEDVLRYMTDNNVERLELRRIAWRMRDRSFYDRAVALLTARHVYDATLWQYSVLHADPPQIAQYLLHEANYLHSCGGRLATTLVDYDPRTAGYYEHLEYEPLVNARAHRLGGRVKILNDAFSEQYEGFCELLAYHASCDASDLLAAAYYLLLADRVADAIGVLDRVRADEVHTRLQYDYLSAYVALYRGEPGIARELASAYTNHPVDKWRKRFAAVLAVLDEAEGASAAVVDADDRTQAQSELAAAQPGFDFTVSDNAVTVTYQNLAEVRVSYYLMDIELLFSRQPFVQQASDRFSIIRPNRTETIALPAGRDELTFDIPAEYRSRNVIVELTAAGTRTSHVNYANDLVIQLVQQYGQVRVSHRGSARPLPSSYVKVYARKHGGDVVFYKDGYTDVRGVFDYTSLSNDELDSVDRFALLIATDDHGAVVREVAPPKR